MENIPLNDIIKNGVITKDDKKSLKPPKINLFIDFNTTTLIVEQVGSNILLWIKEFIEGIKEDRRQTVIRKIDKYITEIKQKVELNYKKIINIMSKSKDYFSSMEGMIEASAKFGYKKGRLPFSKIEYIDNIELFNKRFIESCYDAYKQRQKHVSFYIEYDVSIDIPKKDVRNVFNNICERMVDIIHDDLISTTKRSLINGSVGKDRDATTYKLIFELRFDDVDYGKMFEVAKKVCDEERKKKNLD